MDTIHTIFHYLIISLLLMFYVIIYKDTNIREREFNEMYLNYVVDNASEYAFNRTVSESDLGISYLDLTSVTLGAGDLLRYFKTVLLSSFDMALSEENYKAMDGYISAAVLTVADGYYIAMPKSDTDVSLFWSMKKPYVKVISDKERVSLNISNEKYIYTKQEAVSVYHEKGKYFRDLQKQIGYLMTKDEVYSLVNAQITDDINYQIARRNSFSVNGKDVVTNPKQHQQVHLPTMSTVTGVNSIKKPTFLVVLDNVDFLGSNKLTTMGVGGYTIEIKSKVVGFVENGIKYYCYEGQLPDEGSIDTFFYSMTEAALAGYNPHLFYLSQKSKYQEDLD